MQRGDSPGVVGPDEEMLPDLRAEVLDLRDLLAQAPVAPILALQALAEGAQERRETGLRRMHMHLFWHAHALF